MNNQGTLDALNNGGSPYLCRAAQRVDQSLVYMVNHLDRPLQVATLAALAQTSPSHYFSLFKRQTGYSPIDFFIHLRIRRACRLLEETSLTIKEIAAALGYRDQFYFSRAFKSLAGMAPTEYRKLAPAMKGEISEGLELDPQRQRGALSCLDSPVGAALSNLR